jgi:hypothetical protein
VDKLESSSQHLEIRGSGDVTLHEPLLASALNIYVMFKFLPAYLDKSAMTKSIFSALDRIPKMRQAKRPDGYFGYVIKGDLKSGPRPLPSRTGGIAGGPSGLHSPNAGNQHPSAGLPMGIGKTKAKPVVAGSP